MINDCLNVFFVGIGGSSMRGLALLLASRGANVSGSDTAGCELLESRGFKVIRSHKKENITPATHLVVFSSAVSKDNPERVRATELGICTMERGELLGMLSRGFKKTVAVSGSHGKTTTTGMIAKIFTFAGKDFFSHYGGEENPSAVSTWSGENSDLLLCEACEYHDNFLHLAPTLAVILNVQHDHADYFPTEKDMFSSFSRFASGAGVVLCGSEEKEKLGLQGKNAYTCDVLENGFSQSENCKEDCTACKESENCPHAYRKPPDFSARNIKSENGVYSFDFYAGNIRMFRLHPKVCGYFNMQNAFFAVATAHICGCTGGEIKKGISTFLGEKRRLENIFSCEKSEVFIDYAHHPTQVSALCHLAGELFRNSRVVTIFQPHTFSRTVAFFGDFASALAKFPTLFISPTYPAREDFCEAGSGETLAKAIPHAVFAGGEEDLFFRLASLQEKSSHTTFLFVGAGDINKTAENFARFLQSEDF